MAYFKSLGKRNAYPSNEHREISDYHLQMLAKIYHTCHASIVLSSTWRELDDSENIECYAVYKYLVDSLEKYDMTIMSKTPVINQNRPLEIATWLNSSEDKGKIKFVSLDDDFGEEDYERYGIKNCLIQTNFYCDDMIEGGLQQEHVDRAIEILNK